MTNEQIGNILQLQRGYDLPISIMKEGDVPVVGSNGIIGYHNISKCIQPCITVGRSGSVGKVHYYSKATWVHNTALYVSDFKGNSPVYLYYLLKLLKLERLCGSSVVPSLNRNNVYPMVIPYQDDIKIQTLVSNVLSTIDREIVLSRAINHNLPTLVRSLRGGGVRLAA